MTIPAPQITTILLHEAIRARERAANKRKSAMIKRQHLRLIKNKTYNLKACRPGCSPIKTPMNSH